MPLDVYLPQTGQIIAVTLTPVTQEQQKAGCALYLYLSLTNKQTTENIPQNTTTYSIIMQLVIARLQTDGFEFSVKNINSDGQNKQVVPYIIAQSTNSLFCPPPATEVEKLLETCLTQKLISPEQTGRFRRHFTYILPK